MQYFYVMIGGTRFANTERQQKSYKADLHCSYELRTSFWFLVAGRHERKVQSPEFPEILFEKTETRKNLEQNLPYGGKSLRTLSWSNIFSVVS